MQGGSSAPLRLIKIGTLIFSPGFATVGRSKERAFEQKEKVHKHFPYPDEAIERLARAFYPAILACWNSEEGQREFAAWQAEQAHHTTSKEKQSVPDCWVSVKQFSRNDTATACQDWLRSTRLGRGSIKSHVRTVKVLGMGLFAFQERVHLWKGVTH